MEAGKTYVYKSDADRQAFIGGDYSVANNIMDSKSNGEFTVKRVNPGGVILTINEGILKSEFKYFKLKENKMLKPDDIITVEMTALHGMMLLAVMNRTHGSESDGIYSNLKESLSVHSSPISPPEFDSMSNWDHNSRLKELALAQFKNPNQDKIDELEATIKNAAEELAKIKAGEL